MSSKKYYSYDVKKKCKSRHKKDDSKKHCKDSCKVDHYESESTEYDYYNSVRVMKVMKVVRDLKALMQR